MTRFAFGVLFAGWLFGCAHPGEPIGVIDGFDDPPIAEETQSAPQVTATTPTPSAARFIEATYTLGLEDAGAADAP